MDFESNSFDAVISNGAFCLAPSKEAAFGENMAIPVVKFSREGYKIIFLGG